MSEPICRILSLGIPDMMYSGEGFEIDVRYINDGATGPTFVRTRDRLGNIWTQIDNPNHETGDGSLGFHTYAAMPEAHYIFQLEVGHGTALNPIEVTDRMMLYITNIEVPPLDSGETIFDPSINWPIICVMRVVDMSGAPGQIITREAPIVSTMESAPVHKISINLTTKHGAELNPKFTVDGETHYGSAIYEIAGGQTIMFGITATIPTEMSPDKDYRFRISVVKLEIL